MLEIRDLAVRYGEVAALRGVSLVVRAGEIITLVGGNGAGKSTLLRTISGLLKPASGQVLLDGEPIGRLTPDAIVARGVAHSPEGRRVFPRLTIEENLLVGAHLRRDRPAIRADIEGVYGMFARLRERRRQRAETLSGGEQQMLALGRALMSRPRLLLLDEPSLGLAPLVVEDVARAILGCRKNGVTVLLVEQNVRVALAVADRGYVIETGRIVLSGSSAELSADDAVAGSYLGASHLAAATAAA